MKLYLDANKKEHRFGTCLEFVHYEGDPNNSILQFREVSRFIARGNNKCRNCFPLKTVSKDVGGMILKTYILRNFTVDEMNAMEKKTCNDDRCRMSISPECACKCLGHFHGVDVPMHLRQPINQEVNA